MNNSKEILLNIMYTGTYLENENANIGHEIINLFKADNGNNYIYVLPYGSMSKKHNDKIKTILLVRRCNSKIIEILAKATDLEQVAYIEKIFKNNKKEHIKQLQVKYIDENNITFGGVKPYKIYENNEGNYESIYITFKANTLRKVSNPIYITTDKNNSDCHFMEGVKHFPSQSLKIYIQEETKAFEVLENIINNKTLWEYKNTTPKVQDIIDKIKDDTDNKYNFINIIKKENDELVFSNLFKYIFDSNPNTFSEFVRQVLEIEDFSNDFRVLREEANIDLLILDKNNAIVIENKIKSSINRICK